jgi:Ca2+-binding RTX toxin-like protein
MRGGTGDDTCVVDSASDLVIENANEGADLVTTTLATYTLAENVEYLLYAGASAFGGTGNSLANVLTGAAANDTLSGLAGNDQLRGHAGSDILIGGAGADTLTGGSGQDLFRLLASTDSGRGPNADTIADFNRAEGDRIDLSAVDVNTATGTDDAFSFIGTAAFSGVAGQLRFADGLLAADLNGDRISDFEIRVTGMTSLLAGDFIL